MYPNHSNVIKEFMQLSTAFEQSFNIEQELIEANNIYMELIEVQKKLAEVEKTFSKLN